jgi:hypothetical protein
MTNDRRRFVLRAGSFAALALAAGLAAGRAAADAPVRLNETQVIGTHNSYHVQADKAMLALIEQFNPELRRSLEYGHRPLPEQFSRLGIRQVELDIFADPKGGLFAKPRGPKMAAVLGLPAGGPYDPEGVMRRPGFKVMHVQDVDFRSSVPTFVAGLKQIRDWSAAHPRHFPIFVLVELKDETPMPMLTKAIPFGAAELDAVDAEILSVFQRREILAPDDVRGSFASLPEALAKRGWPTIDAARGKVMFGMDNEGAPRDLYLKGLPALQGRLLFVSVSETHPAAAWMKINDPLGDFDHIQHLVRRGFLVRTRADADTKEARANDPRQRDKALASGAQFVSTDYPEPNPAFSPYCVRFAGGIVVRANPINGNPKLNGKDLEQ